MTAYVVSGLGQARAAGYRSTTTRSSKGRNWLIATLAAHPDMIPDLRAYVVYALATTGGAPKDALDKTWDSRDKLSDEGLALAGLALDAAGDSRAKEAAMLLEKKAKTTDTDAYWAGSYDGPARLLGRHLGRDYGLCAEAAHRGRIAAAACCPRQRSGWPSIATATTGTRPSRPQWSSRASPITWR